MTKRTIQPAKPITKVEDVRPVQLAERLRVIDRNEVILSGFFGARQDNAPVPSGATAVADEVWTAISQATETVNVPIYDQNNLTQQIGTMPLQVAKETTFSGPDRTITIVWYPYSAT